MTSLMQPICDNHFWIDDDTHGLMNFVIPPTLAF